MQGILSVAAPAAAAADPNPYAALSSSNLARHTSSNPPAPRKTVQQYLASVLPVHALNAYELGPPPKGELDHVKTPPRAVEAKRKRRLQDWEDRGETWIRRDDLGTRRSAETRAAGGEALVLIRADSPQSDRGRTHAPRTTGEEASRPRKPLVVAAMKGRSSMPASREAKNKQAIGAAGPPRSRALPDENDDADSDKSSVLRPRAAQPAEQSSKTRVQRKKPAEKENKVAKRKEGTAGRRQADRPIEAAEQAELDDLEDRLRGRRERRRQNALIRKDRSLPAAAVGIAAAAKVKKAAKQNKRALAGDGSDCEASISSEEQAARKPAKRASKEDRSRERVGKLDRPSNVGARRLTVKPVQLGIFGKGKASAGAKVGAARSGAFDEEAFLAGPAYSSGGRGPRRLVLEEQQEEELPSWLAFSTVNKPSRGKTYGNRPAKRRSEPAPRVLADSSSDSSSSEQERELLPPAKASRTTAPPAKKRREVSPRSRGPAFWLDIPAPRSRPNSLIATQPTVEPAAAGRFDGMEGESTQASALSAASLARRKAAQVATVDSVINPAIRPEPILINEPEDVDLGNKGENQTADLAVAGDTSAALEPIRDRPLESPSSGHTSSIGRLIAEIASPESDKPAACSAVRAREEAPPTASSFAEVLDFAPLTLPEPLDTADNYASLLDPTEEVGVVASPGPHPAFAYADLAEDDPTSRTGEPCGIRDEQDEQDENFGLELFDVPSSLPSITEPAVFGARPDPQQDSDEVAFRQAMLRQWPKTTL